MTQSSNLGAVPTGTGATVRANFNAGFQALASDNEGGSAPSPTYPFMRWRNSAAGQLKRRNALNSGWEMLENYAASTDPGTSDDDSVGYIRGSVWINTAANRMWWCLDPTTSAAKWLQLGLPAWRSTQALSVSAVNNASAVTLVNWTLPANTFAVDGDCIDFDLFGTYTNNTGSAQNLIIRLRLGATNIISDGLGSGSIPSSAVLRVWRLSGRIWRASSALVKASMTFGAYDGALTGGAGRGDYALAPIFADRMMLAVGGGVANDWTADSAFSIDMTMSASSASFSLGAEYFKASLAG